MNLHQSFYQNGQLKETGSLIDGKKVGLWTYYYENGAKRLEANYVEDKNDGKWTEWYENEKITEEGIYKNGEYVVRNFWDEEGEQLLINGSGKTIRKFGTSQGDIYEQYFENGEFKGEKKIQGVTYGKFIPNEN